jgi:hypothetical protein
MDHIFSQDVEPSRLGRKRGSNDLEVVPKIIFIARRGTLPKTRTFGEIDRIHYASSQSDRAMTSSDPGFN